MLPSDAKARKEIPVATGFVDYFPLAMCAVAEVSRIGNEQHNPGQPLHWDRSKSTDEADSFMRHFIERGKRDTDGARHTAKAAWRIMALLEKECEAELRGELPTSFLDVEHDIECFDYNSGRFVPHTKG
jgi:hypothetical protein